MNNYQEQTITDIELNDELVMQYLLQSPDFFIRNASLVEKIRIPHPMKGGISLVEWQLRRQRNEIKQLQEEITLLMEYAGLNEMLCKRLLQLQADLAIASTLRDMLKRLQHWARTFGLLDAHVRLFSDRWQLNTPFDVANLALSRQIFEPLRRQRLSEEQHFLGSLNETELQLLLPQAQQVGSVALSLLGDKGDLGVIIFSSHDSQHYQQGMGTVILHQIAKFLPGLLTRWIERTSTPC
ncbi:DUF484 domain-containing protein [Candidatus Fukatsuia symbiotica]|uniref:DUF484 domain-containing protein n=1 Tax=Candidatus Fukatsuia symbiotica TaxID=1878942 RepID=A0A2U8I2X1_9GAMM|nr:DUF484 domain-containing protein [Candidatus Fukatsuia symbiotica]AWK13448.1 DUF484 domain-containing protein [Candidatus Fukatsuia symbiotica]MEA9444340.1 DUF484 domain-containing protein [Candidatus Fukatsuia symbiotica]